MASKSDRTPSNSGPAQRGRTAAASKPTGSTTRTRSTPAAPAKSAADKKPARTPSAGPAPLVAPSLGGNSRTPSGSRSAAPGQPKHRAPTSKSTPSTAAAAIKTSAAPASRAKTPPPPVPAVPSPLPPADASEQAPSTTSDPLQVAAQEYPWIYMTSTLDACFNTAEEQAKKDIDAREAELNEQESGIAEQRERVEAERAINFYDELSAPLFATKAPAVMQAFMQHGDACSKLETEALRLATQDPVSGDEDSPLKIYHDMQDSLVHLQDEAVELESALLLLAEPMEITQTEGGESLAARSQLVGVFAACLPVLRARIANLAMAQELVDGALENISITLRMESLGLLD